MIDFEASFENAVIHTCHSLGPMRNLPTQLTRCDKSIHLGERKQVSGIRPSIILLSINVRIFLGKTP